MAVTITGVAGARGVRLEIRELVLPENEHLRNMYILGLARMQAKPVNDPRSWYQISGIHGLPDEAWDGFELAGGPGPEPGYCVHTTNRFPTWHRPYVALFEVCLAASLLMTIHRCI
jgi:tyrosinase